MGNILQDSRYYIWKAIPPPRITTQTQINKYNIARDYRLEYARTRAFYLLYRGDISYD